VNPQWNLQDPAKVVAEGEGGDDQLFRGTVPQPADWLRAWRACLTPVSFHAAEQNGTTEAFINSRNKSSSRKSFSNMVAIMADVVRARDRKVLEAASSVNIALDDRGCYRMIYWKADCIDPPATFKGLAKDWIGGACGCAGVLRRGGAPEEKTLRDTDDDYSKEMAASVVRSLERLATSLLGGFDREFFHALLKKVRIGTADGGSSVQKCLRFLAAGQCPNMLLILRDPAHLIGHATKDPLLADARFGTWWDNVFGNRHALVPDIKNSDEWTEKLILCQKVVCGSAGVQGGGFQGIVRVMNFAKQRFDSCATPQRQFCCMVVAIAMMLAFITTDQRTASATRLRASARLEEIPRHVLTAGISASFTEESIRFVRLFDVFDHDPALTLRQAEEFKSRMRTLFIHGHVFNEPEPGETALTPLQIIHAQTKEAPLCITERVRCSTCGIAPLPRSPRRLQRASMLSLFRRSSDWTRR